ncbi:hypothetical protein AB0J84_13825 [Micromonospora arborensis]|uniref:hypothetical protein n=1 Tax=Micromonospora arborensis TaxID=2116518 RepID=UPI003442BDBD
MGITLRRDGQAGGDGVRQRAEVARPPGERLDPARPAPYTRSAVAASTVDARLDRAF